jgi:pyruvate ferredoxin oxidoreductase gamma subunit
VLEIRLHGRGGQGSVVAAYLAATAAHDSGFHCQAFPAFGAERRGAPVASFVRIARHPIRRRCEVREPHFVIVQEPGLVGAVPVVEGLRSGGGVLLDGERVPGGLERLDGCRARAVPATRLALDILGRPFPNVALLTVFLRLTEIIPVDALSRALAGRFGGEILERNRRLVNEATTLVSPGEWKEFARAAL